MIRRDIETRIDLPARLGDSFVSRLFYGTPGGIPADAEKREERSFCFSSAQLRRMRLADAFGAPIGRIGGFEPHT